MRANLATQIRLHHPVSLLNLPAPESFSLDLIFLFLPTIFFCYLFLDPPGGLSEPKKVLHTLSKLHPGKSPGITPDPESGQAI